MVDSGTRGPGARPPEDPPLGLRERKKQEQRRRIYDAATQLISLHGYEATTVEEIARQADVARATVFKYFPRKQLFLFAFMERMLEQFRSEIGSPADWPGTAHSQLHDLFSRLVELSERHREVSSRLMLESIRSVWLHSREQPAVRQLERMIRGVLRNGQQRGELSTHVDPELGAELLGATLFTTLVGSESPQRASDGLARVMARKLDVIFFGLATREAGPEV